METLIAGKSTAFQKGKHVGTDVGGAAGGGTWDSVCLAHLVLVANPLSLSGSSLPTFSLFAEADLQHGCYELVRANESLSWDFCPFLPPLLKRVLPFHWSC